MVGTRALLSTLQGIVAYPNLCIANLADSSKSFNPALAATEDGVPISLLLGGGPTGLKAQAGSVLMSYDVTIESLNYRNAHTIGTDPAVPGNTLYSGELMLRLKKNGQTADVAGGTSLRERSVGTMTVSVNPATSRITGCYALTDARQSCIEVGGTYDDATYPKCKMPYPCAGVPNAIFLGYSSSGAPLCQTMAQVVGSLCPAGQFIVSDGAGKITCKTP
jgi:hypothetical protein